MPESRSASAFRMFESRVASASPISASRLTSAVRARPSASRYPCSSWMSRSVKLTISRPMFAMSGPATSRTRWAKASRSW